MQDDIGPETGNLTDGCSISDADLVRSVQGGSDPALQMLYQRYLHVVWRYVYVRARRDENVVEDIVSDTFLAAIRGLRDLDPEGGSVCGWLMGIARHKLADHWRQARRNRYDSPMLGT